MQGHQDAELFPADGRLEEALGDASQALPKRRVDTDMTPYSKVCWAVQACPLKQSWVSEHNSSCACASCSRSRLDVDSLPPSHKLHLLGSLLPLLSSACCYCANDKSVQTLRNPLACFPNAPHEFQDAPPHRAGSSHERQVQTSG